MPDPVDVTQATLAELTALRRIVRGDATPDAGATATRDTLTGLDRVSEIAGLSAFERSVLLLAAGPDLVGAVASELAERTGVPHLTFGAALAMLPDAHWSAIAPAGGLRRWLLLEPEDPTRIVTSRLLVDERVLHLIAGLDLPDERVVRASGVLPAPASLPSAWERAATDLAAAWASGPVRLTGVGPGDAAGVAARAAHHAGRPLRDLAAADLAPHPDGAWRLARLVEREVRLGTAAFWVDLTAWSAELAAGAQRSLAGVPMVAFIGGTATPFAVPPPTHAEWADLVASRARADTDPLTWDDLVLPVPQLDQLKALVASARQKGKVLDDWGFARRQHRGLGTSALFVGPSGTGKTFAADIVASELGRELIRIDLSQVVSKYIGETEKNLAKVFDDGEQGGSVLFFDEADALFGKRTEVRDSHDRYANIEVSYLLQRLERFSGLAILASNARSALDTAFVRRLTSIVTFPHPDAEARLLLWQRAFPAEMPRGDLDLAALAKVDATGATIMAAALAGAYLAAEADVPVSTAHVLRALDWELAKSGRPRG